MRKRISPEFRSNDLLTFSAYARREFRLKDKFTRVTFRNYKALKRYSLSLNEFNVLVGPNNAGKSTIVGAFRILSEGIRKASSRKPRYLDHPAIKAMGYDVPLNDLPIATENIFTNYDDSDPASIEFELATGNKLRLVFPERDACYLVCDPIAKAITTTTAFKSTFQTSVGFVPVLGPVEHNEPLYQREAARLALLTHRASRNFRNIWHHFPDDFDEFRNLIATTWPGMDIEKPEIDRSHERPVLHMFCPEGRYPREIYWAGFGFQVWCQMLTYIIRAKNDSLLIIDEPDIYLHSDLQRQMVEILRGISPDVLIATHSTEIISESESSELLVIDKKHSSARRIKNASQLQAIFSVLGSNLNPTLTQLAKSKRVVFVEGKDFKLLSAFARQCGKQPLANRSDFAVMPVEGFNPAKVHSFSQGIEHALGTPVLKAVIFDRDYRSPEEVEQILRDLGSYCSLSHIHRRKEVENYLFVNVALYKAINKRISARAAREGMPKFFEENIARTLENLTAKLKSKVQAQFLSRRQEHMKANHPKLDRTTINQKLIDEFDDIWANPEHRLEIVPGKELLAMLNDHLQEQYSVSVTPLQIITEMKRSDIPTDLLELIKRLEEFRCHPV